MNMHGSRFLGFIFWATYLIAALACWLTTYQVFAQSDTPLVAGLAAASIDGVLALTLYLMGRTNHQDQRTTALIGTFVFGVFSAFAQVIHRFDGLGLVMPEWMRIVSLFLLPASTTGGLVLLGVLKYFSTSGGNKNQGGGNRGGNQQYRESQPQMDQIGRGSYGGSPAPEQATRAQIPQVQANGNGHSNDKLNMLRGMQGQGGNRKFPNDLEPAPRLVDRKHPTPPD